MTYNYALKEHFIALTDSQLNEFILAGQRQKKRFKKRLQRVNRQFNWWPYFQCPSFSSAINYDKHMRPEHEVTISLGIFGYILLGPFLSNVNLTSDSI